MSYLDAHNARLQLAEDITRPKYGEYMGAFGKSQAVQRKGLPGSQTVPHITTPDELQATLRSAETFTMTANMWYLMRAVSEDMPDTPLLPEDLPSNTGFLWCPEPFEQIDLHGRLLRMHVVTWRVQGQRVLVDWFTDRYDPKDEINISMQATPDWFRQVGRHMLMQTTVLTLYAGPPNSPDCGQIRELDKHLSGDWRQQYLVYEEEFFDDDGTRQIEYVPVLNEDGNLTEDQFDLVQRAYVGLGETRLRSFPVRQLICFWRLCQQTLTAREYVHPDRHLAKRMVRRGFATSPITVITLRRQSAKREEGREVEWDHRWLRRGHWRQQWFGSGESRYQKAIYINPTICGPEDKPLLIRPHVNILSR